MTYYIKINSYKEAIKGFNIIQNKVNTALGKSIAHKQYIEEKMEREAYLVFTTDVLSTPYQSLGARLVNNSDNNVFCHYGTLRHELTWLRTSCIELKLHNKIKY